MTDKKLSLNNPKTEPAHRCRPPPHAAARRRRRRRSGVFAAGYGETVAKGAKGLITGSSGKTTQSATRGNSLTPEFRIDPASGKLTTQPGQVVSPPHVWAAGHSAACVCASIPPTTVSSVSPATPITRWPPPTPRPWKRRCARSMPCWAVTTAWKAAPPVAPAARPCSSTKKHRTAFSSRSSAWAHGSGQWKSITLEELVQEICEGGDLFGEGHVDGLRAIRDVNTLIDEANPEYGPSPTSCW
jgi:tetrathionate reductase subunit A